MVNLKKASSKQERNSIKTKQILMGILKMDYQKRECLHMGLTIYLMEC